MRRTRLFAAACLSTLLCSAGALAVDKAACLDAASKAQVLRDENKLVDARRELRVCAQQECPVVVQQDCAGWLADVEKSLPTVVVSAKDDAGADLTDVAVAVDGAPFLKRLEGESVPIDPGAHVFHFEWAGGPGADLQVLVKQGGKDQGVTVVLKRATAQAGTTAGVPPPPFTVTPSPSGAETAPPSTGRSPWRTVGWITAGVGAAGLVVGSVFGGLAVGAKNGACNGDACNSQSAVDDITTKSHVSTVGFVAGGVLLAVAVALLVASGAW